MTKLSFPKSLRSNKFANMFRVEAQGSTASQAESPQAMLTL